MSQYNKLVLVDQQDREIGVGEKQEVHVRGVLHRAFSIFVFNDFGEMLLQRRAFSKYHSAGLWTNACCSHPVPGELIMNAAKRRIQEEMNFDCDLEFVYKFVYKAEVDNGLIEHELDHVFIGTYNGVVNPNSMEVVDYEYKSLKKIELEMSLNPGKFTIWFRIIFYELLPLFKIKYGS